MKPSKDMKTTTTGNSNNNNNNIKKAAPNFYLNELLSVSNSAQRARMKNSWTADTQPKS